MAYKAKTKKNDYDEVLTAEVDRVREVKKIGTMFTLILNGVTINNCKVISGKNGDFIALPTYKGTDGNYYNYVWFKFSPEDEEAILKMVEEASN